MAPAFGTSGLRGLVTELTDELVSDYVNAFLTTVDCDTLYVGRDLRPSSPEIASVVCRTALSAGVDVVDCGALGTPALALSSMNAGAAAIMVTGSHIPADRNGLKFYLPHGEVLKDDEAKITQAYSMKAKKPTKSAGTLTEMSEAEKRYIDRYISAFGTDALSGLRVGVYRHSSVARDTMETIFKGLGAEIVPLAHSDTFIPVDTEAVDPETRTQLQSWCEEFKLDAIASTDGDADRPMLCDATGTVIPGDILGVITSKFLGATHIVTPVSSNDMVRQIPEFEKVDLTRIGSPFVIAGMLTFSGANVVGFEANGGYLLGFTAQLKTPLSPLPTRDCMLPILASLASAKSQGQSLVKLVNALPPCFTAADRLMDIDKEKAAAFLERLITDETIKADFFKSVGPISATDLTDGIRVAFGETGEVVHLRPSGNAPEFRVYTQAKTKDAAAVLLKSMLGKVERTLED